MFISTGDPFQSFWLQQLLEVYFYNTNCFSYCDKKMIVSECFVLMKKEFLHHSELK